MYIGDFTPGSIIYIPFNTFNGSGASVTMTGFAVTGIEVYKNGSMTQRASDNGYTLLDTDGIDIDSVTGFHGFSIDTSDNSDSGFFTNGSDFWVVVTGLTIDSQSVSVIAATFSIGNRRSAGELVKTTIATLASQTSFTLTAGSADDNAYNNCIVVIQDIASGVQCCIGVVSDYTGSTKTVTLLSDPGIFTFAAGDNITILASQAGLMSTPAEFLTAMKADMQSDPTNYPVNVMEVNGVAQTGNDNGADINTILSRIIGTLASGTHNPQSGDSFAIVNDGTYGNSGIKTLLDAIAGYVDTEISTIITHLTDIKGATFSESTDSLEAIRDRGDAAWITGEGGGGGDATAANQTTIISHLTDIKGGTWSDETLVALKADLETLLARITAKFVASLRATSAGKRTVVNHVDGSVTETYMQDDGLTPQIVAIVDAEGNRDIDSEA